MDQPFSQTDPNRVINSTTGETAAQAAAGSTATAQTTVTPPTSTSFSSQTVATNSSTTIAGPAPVPPSATGLDDASFINSLNGMQTGFNQNNDLLKQRSALLQQLYTGPGTLTPAQLSALPPDMQQLIQSGNTPLLQVQLQTINDQLAGRENGLASSIQYLTTGYQQAEKSQQDAYTTVLNYAKSLNQKPSDIMKSLYPSLVGNMSPDQLKSLDSLAAPLLTSTQVAPIPGSSVTIPTGTIASQTNNPLNIKYSPTSAAGGTDSGISNDGGQSTFASFASPEDGLAAAVNLLKSPDYTNLTVDQAMEQWSGGSYGAEVSPGLNGSQKMSSLSDDQLNQLVSDMGTKESGANVSFGTPNVDALPPSESGANTPDPTTQLTPNGVYQAALDWAFGGKMIPTGIGTNSIARTIRADVVNKAAAIASATGTNFPAMQALYKANSSAAKQNVERLARVESVMNATQANFPRLATLADQVKAQGINLTEADVQSGQASVLSKFGSPEAASYVELINTIRSDYSAAQAALAGSRGGQFFAQNAQEAIPLGLTAEQYNAIKDTLVLSSTNATTAINGEVQSLLGTSGSIDQSGGSSTTQTPTVIAPTDIPSGYYQASDGLLYKK